jgi:SAM-dependent methyltransferase
MPNFPAHPVDSLTDEQLRAIMLRVDARKFPGKLEQLWQAEHVRYRQTLRRIPPAMDEHARLLDLGSSRPWVPFFVEVLGYRHLTLNTSYPDSGFVAEGLSVGGSKEAEVRMSVFDIERDSFPHDDETFDVVLCLEVLEHLAVDPMAMMAEVNRVLKPGGVFVLSTPNALRHANLVNMILGEQPMGYVGYNGFDTNRHNRIYTPGEVQQLLQAAGISPIEVTTFGTKNRGLKRRIVRRAVAAAAWPISGCPRDWRNDVILVSGRKTTAVATRRPSWLYFDLAERQHVRSQ